MKLLIPLLIVINCVHVSIAAWRSPLKPAIHSDADMMSIPRVGEEVAGIHEVPYTVSLRLFGKHFCGGAIISRNWVISAAQCFLPVAPVALLQVRSGSSFSNFGGSLHSVNEIHCHENFTVTREGRTVNDIAVVRVNPSFRLNRSTRRAVVMPDPGQLFPYYNVGVVSGWGVIPEHDNRMPYVLQKVGFVPNLSCRRSLVSYTGQLQGQFCADYMPEEATANRKDACQADAGAPFVVNEKLHGIVSWGKGCAQPVSSGVFTEILFYRQWIKHYTDI